MATNAIANYAIQKWVGSGKPNPKSTNRNDWALAYGLNHRSWPDVRIDEEAIVIFNQETAKSRTASFRLIAFRGMSYSTTTSVIATKNC